MRNEPHSHMRLAVSHYPRKVSNPLAISTAMTDNAPTRDNPILAKFRAALNQMYGDRIERVVL